MWVGDQRVIKKILIGIAKPQWIGKWVMKIEKNRKRKIALDE